MTLLFILCTHHVQWKCIHELHIHLDSRMVANTSHLFTHDLNHHRFLYTLCPSATDRKYAIRPLCHRLSRCFRPPTILSTTEEQDNLCHGPKCVTLIRDSPCMVLWCYSSVLWYPCVIHGYQDRSSNIQICGWNVVALELMCAPDIVLY